MVDIEVLRAAAPHICWKPVGCDKHFCSLDKGHTVDCFSLHLSPCNINDKPFDGSIPADELRKVIKETIIDHFGEQEEEEEEVYSIPFVPTFATKIVEHTCERLLEKENYGNYYMIHKTDAGWMFKTGMEAHIIFNCPYCGDELL